jgi:hypothetical protein
VERELQNLNCRELQKIFNRLRDWPVLAADVARVMSMKGCPSPPPRRWLW